MSREDLYLRLVTDLKDLKLPVEEFKLSIRPFSKTLYGRYYPSYQGNKARVFIYPYITSNSKVMFSYSTILYHTLHEVCHHIQYSDPNFVRKKGIMHDSNFYKLLNHYVSKAESKGLMKKELAVI